MSASGGTGNSPGAEAGTETALQRFIAISYVQKQHDAIPADETRGFRIGDRVKRGTKKQVEYGYVVYLFIKHDKPSIMVLWMRGATLAPKGAVVAYSDAELPKLDSFRNNYPTPPREASRRCTPRRTCCATHGTRAHTPAWQLPLASHAAVAPR